MLFATLAIASAARRRAARPWHELGRENDLGGDPSVLQQAEEQLGGLASDRDVVAADDGDRRPVEAGDRDVVATEERDVTPDLEPSLGEDLERTDHQLVAARDD